MKRRKIIIDVTPSGLANHLLNMQANEHEIKTVEGRIMLGNNKHNFFDFISRLPLLIAECHPKDGEPHTQSMLIGPENDEEKISSKIRPLAEFLKKMKKDPKKYDGFKQSFKIGVEAVDELIKYLESAKEIKTSETDSVTEKQKADYALPHLYTISYTAKKIQQLMGESKARSR